MNNHWAALAVPFDEVEWIHYPVLVQCKLNGIRARWDGRELITRQGKIWKRETLPFIYAKLEAWSKLSPGIVLDGELYAHGAPFQAIESITAVNRQIPHEHHRLIDFHAFDIISDEPSERRQEKLSALYDPWVATSLVSSLKGVETFLHMVVEAGFEGLMIRALGVPYIPGRGESLIKLKPWKYANATIVGFKIGQGKYAGTLGALQLSWEGILFFASGGLSDETRNRIWNNRETWLSRGVVFKYRDTSNKGVPMFPQIERLL